MLNFCCVKWGDKYDAVFVNRLYNMILRHCKDEFKFYCYTDQISDFHKKVIPIQIKSDLKYWWPKLDLLNYFQEGETILFDLDIVILKDIERLLSVKTRTVSVLLSYWKKYYLKPEEQDRYPTIYNSSIMKWSGTQGIPIYKHFVTQKELYLLKYKGVDRYFFNEPVDIDILPTSIAYSYWKGARYGKDTESELYRGQYEVCILNHGKKNNEVKGWIHDYWY
jgi:hypothetical protein